MVQSPQAVMNVRFHTEASRGTEPPATHPHSSSHLEYGPLLQRLQIPAPQVSDNEGQRDLVILIFWKKRRDMGVRLE